jgi:hypothetical protein
MEKRLAETEKQKQKLANEAEFYQKGNMPDALKTQIERNAQDIEAQKKAIVTRGQEIAGARQRFEEEKQRYIRLTAGNPDRQR